MRVCPVYDWPVFVATSVPSPFLTSVSFPVSTTAALSDVDSADTSTYSSPLPVESVTVPEPASVERVSRLPFKSTEPVTLLSPLQSQSAVSEQLSKIVA